MQEGRQVWRWSAACLLACPLVAEVGRASRLQDLPDAGGGPLVVCSLHFGRFAALLLRCWA